MNRNRQIVPRPDADKLYEYACDVLDRLKNPIFKKHEKDTYENLTLTTEPEDLKQKVELEFVNKDVVEILHDHNKEGFRPLILNACNEKRAGGYWDDSIYDHEAGLMYRSTLSLSMDDDSWPLSSNEVVYTPHVGFFRNHNWTSCRSMHAGVASLAPTRRPDFSIEQDKQRARNKIESIFLIAMKHNHNSLILTPFGVGTWDNDASETAKIFAEFIETYQKKFVRITFCFERTADDPTLLIFRKAICKTV